MTEGELEKVRRDNQFSKLFIAIHNPAVVFSCRVNQTFDSLDKVVEVLYNGATGDYEDILPGMTAWIGSSAGAWDYGQVRVRKSATSDTLFVGENSDVKWADEAYITVVDEFGIWPKHPRVVSADEVYMDYDVAYDDQHTAFAPVPILEHQCLWLTGASVSTQLDAGDSWCLADGEMSFLWTASGGTLIDEDTSTPIFEATAAGVYRISCTVTVGDGVQTGHRYIFVYDSENMPFLATLRNTPSGSYERGGWDGGFTITDPVGLSIVRDRALCILFSMDFYGSDKVSLGPVAGSENIIHVGWLAGESLNINPVRGNASFEVWGPHQWISTLEEFIDGLEDTPADPTAWTQIKNLTVDKCLWHLITWRSTVSQMMSCYLSGDSRQALALQSGEGDQWSQITRNAAAIAAKPCCDRYGRMFVEVNQQLIPEDERSSIPVVMSITKKDWTGSVNVIRNPTSRISQIVLSGVHYETGTEGTAYFALAPGHVFKRYGSTTSVERLLLNDQAQANSIAGLMLGWQNRTYDFDFPIAANNRMVDICPQQYVAATIAPEDNPRGVSFDGRVVIREITLDWKEKESFMSAVWTGEEEAFPENSTVGDVPGVDEWDSSVPPLPKLPSLPSLPVLYPPPNMPNSNQPKVVVGCGSAGVFYTRDFDSDSPTWYLMNNGIDTADRAKIYKIIVTPSGSIWILCRAAFYDVGTIYYCSGLGGTWVKYASGADFHSGHGCIEAIGYDPTSTERIAFLTTNTSENNDHNSIFHYGNSGGYSNGSAMGSNHDAPADIIFWNGNWYLAHSLWGVFATPWVTKFSASGTYIDSASINTDVGQDFAARFMLPLPSFIFEWDGSGAGGWNEISSAIVATRFTDLSFDPSIQSVSFSPSGNVALAAKASVSIETYKTTDGGASWSDIASVVPAGANVIENCRDDFRFILGGGATIKLTMDAGATAPINKVGNLSLIAPLIDITGIRYIS